MTRVLEQPLAMPPEHRFSRAQYYRMAELDLFLDERVELIDGRITLMPPQGNNHDVATTLAHELFLRTFGAEYWVRAQMSLDLAPMSAPEPDVAVVQGSAANSLSKPRSALLLVEVSASTVQYDRTTKQRLYASNGISDYWIINLIEWQLEVYRDPSTDVFEGFTHRYSEPRIFSTRDSVAPLFFPSALISVAQLFPSVRNAK